MKRALVVLFSGGMDSTTLLWWAIKEGWTVWPLSIHYGQRHEVELTAAEHLLSVASQVLDQPLAGRAIKLNLEEASKWVFQGSSQTWDAEVPEGHYEDPSMKVTVVPNRNMVMLAMATALAQSKGCEGVAYAAHGGDHAIYPDCRPEFVERMREAIRFSGYEPTKLLTPFLSQTKRDIALLGRDLGVPFQLTYSCYKGETLHCGKCGTCVERREAFRLAGFLDPTEYEA